MIKRLYAIIFICLLATPLLLAQDSESNNSPSTNIGGAWQLSWQGRDGSQQATIDIQQDGSKLIGTFQSPRGSSALTGSVDGNHVSFSVQMQGRRNITLAFTGTIDGDKMSGTFSLKAAEVAGVKEKETDKQVIPGARFANKASLAARMSQRKPRMKTTNTDFECS